MQSQCDIWATRLKIARKWYKNNLPIPMYFAVFKFVRLHWNPLQEAVFGTFLEAKCIAVDLEIWGVIRGIFF
jgi:hypothetical protein